MKWTDYIQFVQFINIEFLKLNMCAEEDEHTLQTNINLVLLTYTNSVVSLIALISTPGIRFSFY